MASRIKFTVNRNAIAKAIVREYESVAEPRIKGNLGKAAEYAAGEARKGYATAHYDGVVDADVQVKRTNRGYEVTAYGQCVPFIEYGTGVMRDPSYVNEKSHHPFWFFSADGDVRLTGSGSVAKHYTTGGYDRYFYVGARGAVHYIHPWDRYVNEVKFDKDGNPTAVKTGQFTATRDTIAYRDIQVEHVPKSFEYREHSYYTKGNPPNYVMQNAQDKLLEYFLSENRK